MTAAILALDILLALGATLRLTRFIVADDVPGTWFIKDPLHDLKHASQRRWMARQNAEYDRLSEQRRTLLEGGADPATVANPLLPWSAPEPRWARYLEGLSCPFCISVYMAAAVTLALYLSGGAGDAADWWRYVAGFLTLAWLTGHIAARAGDTED